MIELARSLGLCEFRVMFPPAVPTELLIAAAEADGDVGLVPYTPAGANYANCSPNKLSQYMSAGLPILANATNFVTEVVVSAKSGLVVDFNSETKLVEAVSKLCDDSFRQSCGVNALDYFERSFNWAAVSAPFYAAVHCAVGNSEETHLLFYQARPESNQGSRFNASSVTASASSIRVRLAHESITYKVLRRVWRSLPSAARLRLRDVRERVVRKPFP